MSAGDGQAAPVASARPPRDRVGGVAIGRDEARHLRACLASLAGQVGRVVYVDSGSRDDSVALARAGGADVLELDASAPFTAARARNRGFGRLRRDRPALEYVQFVDGDCALAAGWVEAAVRHLDEHADVAVVCGRLREARPEASVYQRLCDMEWNQPAGETAACGGVCLVRAPAFERVGGFDDSLIAGEEPEFCYRLRRAGGRVVRLEAEMASHEADMMRFGPWWSRMIRSGYAYAEGVARYGRAPERYNVRESLRIWFWSLGVPALAAGGALAIGGAGLLALLLYPALVLRIGRERARRGDRWVHGLVYGGFLTLARWAQLLGQLRWLADRARGGRPRPFEGGGGSP